MFEGWTRAGPKEFSRYRALGSMARELLKRCPEKTKCVAIAKNEAEEDYVMN